MGPLIIHSLEREGERGGAAGLRFPLLMPVGIDFLRKRKQEIHSSNPCVRETREAKQQTSIFGPENKRTVFFLGFGKKERKSGPINSSCLSKSQNQALAPLFFFGWVPLGALLSDPPFSPCLQLPSKKGGRENFCNFPHHPAPISLKKEENVIRYTPLVRKKPNGPFFRQVR